MYSKLTKTVLLCSVALSVAACSNLGGKRQPLTPENIAAKESLYENTRNYNSLISMYREVLKNKEDSVIRYKLAEAYYRKGDSKSSIIYLKPLLNMSPMNEKAEILQAKNLNLLRHYDEALQVENRILAAQPSNGEVYNLRGVTKAGLGKLHDAREDLNKAREYFVNDVVAINNLAMLSIINEDYKNAVELLLPQYLNGERDQRLVHNLIFALVKNNDLDYAKDIIVKEKVNTSPDSLIDALKKTNRVSNNIVK